MAPQRIPCGEHGAITDIPLAKLGMEHLGILESQSQLIPTFIPMKRSCKDLLIPSRRLYPPLPGPLFPRPQIIIEYLGRMPGQYLR